jgi:hypothetical protein
LPDSNLTVKAFKTITVSNGFRKKQLPEVMFVQGGGGVDWGGFSDLSWVCHARDICPRSDSAGAREAIHPAKQTPVRCSCLNPLVDFVFGLGVCRCMWLGASARRCKLAGSLSQGT